MSDQIEISVIIPAKNAAATIGDCLKALGQQTYSQDKYEIIVVDDGSTDDTAKIAYARRAKVISQRCAGPAAARNRGVEDAKGEIILFTDADCQPLLNWIEEMAKPFRNPKIAGVKGIYRSRQESLTARFVQAEYEDKYRRMKRFASIDFVDTYSAGFRKSVFLEAGGYDTQFPYPSVEDQEFSFRLAAMGAKMVFNPEAIVYHHHAADVRRYFWKKYRIAYWKMLVIKLHPDKAVKDSHTPQRLKVQILLVYTIITLLCAGLLWKALWWLALGMMVVSELLELPFIMRYIRSDPVLAWAASFYVWIRSLALGAGMLAGYKKWR